MYILNRFVLGFGKDNSRVADARDSFNEFADLFDETFEMTAPGGGNTSDSEVMRPVSKGPA